MNPESPLQPTLAPPVQTLSHTDRSALERLLNAYGLALVEVPTGERVPGSYWGESEAGLIGAALYGRADTPVHSLLHEACHYICMAPSRRTGLHTDAAGGYAEENGVCYLQIVLADHLPGVGAARLMQDMDAWGYSFRLGRRVPGSKPMPRMRWPGCRISGCWTRTGGRVGTSGCARRSLRDQSSLPDTSR